MTGLTKEQQGFVDRVDAGESIWEETEPRAEEDVLVKEHLKKMIAVRLTEDQWRMLYLVAKELGVGPATLSRMWILERLKPLAASMRPHRGVDNPATKP